MSLNPHQQQVADHFESRALVIAGPGSGKTSTITARIGRLLAKQVDPRTILCITFTNKAAGEMRDRMTRAYGERAKLIHVCTFHALAGELLRTYGAPLGYTRRMTIMDEDDQENLMAQIARQKYADDPEVEITKPKIKTLLLKLNDWRENLRPEDKMISLVEDEEIEETELAVMQEYLRRLRAANSVDFSGLLSETVRLLRHKIDGIPDQSQVLHKLHQKYKFIQVDEYQDTNTAQNEIVELLAGESDNVLAVGDQDQSIYEWRGANPEGIARFVNRGKGKRGCATYTLAINYRSTPEIIAVADKLIRHCPNRMAIDFAAHHPSLAKPPQLQGFDTPELEGASIAEKIKALINLRGIAPHEIAVFYRLNDMSRPIEQALTRLQIPYKVVGGSSFYDRAEIKDCIAMLKLLCNPRDASAFARVINKPKRGIGEKAIGQIENYAIYKECDLITACSWGEEIFPDHRIGDAVREFYSIYHMDTHGKSTADALAEITQRTRYDAHLESHEKEDKIKIDERKRYVQELINSIALWEQDNPGSSIENYLQYVTLLTSLDDKRGDDAVRLMSLHSSKGLEFDAVFMVGVEQGMLPHKKAVDERPDAGLNEERRLCYVGLTRARKQLFVSYCLQRQGGFQRGKGVQYENRRPSQFLLEAGLMSETELQNAKARKSMVS